MTYYFVESPTTGKLSSLPPNRQLEFLVPKSIELAPPDIERLRKANSQAPPLIPEEINRQYPPARNQDPHYRKTILYQEVITSTIWPEKHDPTYVPESLKPPTKTLPPQQLFFPNMQES